MLLGGIKMDYLQIANSTTLWITCAIPVLLIAFQAVIFVCKSLNAANALGITKHQINSAVRSSAIASFGPCLLYTSRSVSQYINIVLKDWITDEKKESINDL